MKLVIRQRESLPVIICILMVPIDLNTGAVSMTSSLKYYVISFSFK